MAGKEIVLALEASSASSNLKGKGPASTKESAAKEPYDPQSSSSRPKNCSKNKGGAGTKKVPQETSRPTSSQDKSTPCPKYLSGRKRKRSPRPNYNVWHLDLNAPPSPWFGEEDDLDEVGSYLAYSD